MDKIDIKKFKKYVEYLKNDSKKNIDECRPQTDYNREYWRGNVYMVE